MKKKVLWIVVAAFAALVMVGQTSAGIAWCARDPMVQINGDPYLLRAAMQIDQDALEGVVFTVEVPQGTDVQVGGMRPDETVNVVYGDSFTVSVNAETTEDGVMVLEVRDLKDHATVTTTGTTDQVLRVEVA